MTDFAPDIFLSYSREDAAVAKTYAEAFAREGLRVWWDATLRSGEAYDEVTEGALRSAKAVVVLWSPRSVVSRWVRAEATIADRNKTLTPVMIEPCERPVMFELTQTAELSGWRGGAEDPAWRAFLGDVRRRTGRRESQPFTAAPAEEPATVESDKTVVALLPLTHRVGDEEMEILAEDLTDEITRELALNPFFKVIAAGALAAWRGKAIDYQSLGRQLEAHYLIEAKLQRTGDAVRLTAQLIEAATGGVLQSTRLSRKLSDIEASPDEFPGTVAAQLGQLVLQVEMSRALTKRAPLSGWDHLLRARAYSSRFGSDSSRKFLEEARSAAAALPSLSLTHAMLACALATDVLHAEFSTTLSHEIQAEIKRAVQLGPDDPVIIGYLQSAYDGVGDGEACLRLARRAVELSPNSPRAQYLLARAYNMLGHGAEAIQAFRELDRLTPTDHAILGAYANLGLSHLLESEWAEAETAYDQSLAVQPDSPQSLMGKAVAAALQGKEQIALATLRRLRDVEPQMILGQLVRLLTWHGRAAERLGEPVVALRRLWVATEGDP
jgi:TolB-like protein/cytochrome c-type biogenesis protein CcmH/NrfG